MIFVIYSCRKRLHLANQLYDMLETLSVDVYIAYGDPTIPDLFQLVEKTLILKVGDEYEDLSSKTNRLMQAVSWLFPGQGMVKCDDDIIPCVSDLKKKFNLLTPHHYAGVVQVKAAPETTMFHQGKTTDRKYDSMRLTVPKCSYAGGPMYYLSSNAVLCLASMLTHYNFFEDAYVGFNLNQRAVFPAQVELYSDRYFIPASISYHNARKKIYCNLHGGLGNQLFQVASCIGLAAKHGSVLLLVSKSPNCYTESVFRHLNVVKHLHQNIAVYSETDNIACFKVNDVPCNTDVYVHAYLQNEEYFKHFDVRSVFLEPERTKQALKAYPLAATSMFIHVRRGDYVGNPLYAIDYDTYYEKALNIAKSVHYYVVTDDAAYCQTYALFEGCNVTIVDDTPLNSLYLMTVCAGGICSNSSFSWWGGYLNQTPGKIIVFPEHWINNGAETNIRFEGSVGV